MSQRPGPPLLQARGLCFAYGAHAVLRDWSADIAPGLTAVLGEESSGKTTLLHLLAGTLRPQGGELQWPGAPGSDAPSNESAKVFWIDPRTNAFDAVPVQDFLEQQRSAWPHWNAALLEDLVAGFDLLQHLHKQMHMLSTGSRRKVYLACAFASGAPLTLLDTPFAALDRRSVLLLQELLQEAAEQAERAFVLADYEAPPIDAAHSTLWLQRL